MGTPVEVIDLKSGNVIGGYGSEDEALASLRRFLRTHGQRAIQDLSLMRHHRRRPVPRRHASRPRALGTYMGAGSPALPMGKGRWRRRPGDMVFLKGQVAGGLTPGSSATRV
jgi:hypothetical protein